ncbi:hypothetical protein ABKV19_026897 [Rosa sericea]
MFVVSSTNSVCDYSFQTRADPDEHKATIFAAEPSVRPIQRKRRDERKGEENGEEGREGKETDRKLLTKTTQVEESAGLFSFVLLVRKLDLVNG